jgi:atlastin
MSNDKENELPSNSTTSNAVKRGSPLQLVKLSFGDEPTVEVDEEVLATLKRKLRALGVSKISIVSVMGAFRTGKSFILDLMLRFLRYEARCRDSGIDPNEGYNPPERGTGALDDYPLPKWITDAGDSIEGVGSAPDGFKAKGGMDACTEGIWVWSEPFLRTLDGEEVGLLLMDTQGAWDGQMTKEQSATIFGLTAVLSSKEIYNVSMQIQEDKVENLTYFMRFAQTAIQKASVNIPPECVAADDINRPFQTLDFLVRDWKHFKKDMTVQACKDNMKEHLARHTDPTRVRENSTAEMLNSMFQNIGCYCLPHPGFAIEDDDWTGAISDVGKDFFRFADLYIRDVFGRNLQSKKILGSDLTPLTFDLVVKDFINAFKDAAPVATTFTQAITNSTVLLAKEQAMKSYTKKMEEVLSTNPRGVPEKDWETKSSDIVKQVQEEFKRITIFGASDVRTDTWTSIQESLETLAKRYLEDNTRRLEKALAGFANITIVGVSLFVLDRLSDWTCDWWSQTCVELSKLMLMAYVVIFFYIGWHVYLLFNERGKIAAAGAGAELWKEMARLLGVYADLFGAVKWSDVPAVLKKIASGKTEDVVTGLNKKKD